MAVQADMRWVQWRVRQQGPPSRETETEFVPVCPYANSVALKPSKYESSNGTAHTR